MLEARDKAKTSVRIGRYRRETREWEKEEGLQQGHHHHYRIVVNMTSRAGQEEPELGKKEGSWKAKTRLGGVKTAFASFRIEAQRRGRQ